MRRILQNDPEALTAEKRETILQLLEKLDGTDRQTVIDNALLNYIEKRLGPARIRKVEAAATNGHANGNISEAAPTPETETVATAVAVETETATIAPAPETNKPAKASNKKAVRA